MNYETTLRALIEAHRRRENVLAYLNDEQMTFISNAITDHRLAALAEARRLLGRRGRQFHRFYNRIEAALKETNIQPCGHPTAVLKSDQEGIEYCQMCVLEDALRREQALRAEAIDVLKQIVKEVEDDPYTTPSTERADVLIAGAA